VTTETEARFLTNAPRLTYGAHVRNHKNPERKYGPMIDNANEFLTAVAGEVSGMLADVDTSDAEAFNVVFRTAKREEPEFLAALIAAAIIRLARAEHHSPDAMSVTHNESTRKDAS
jgi:hypothetical protein